MFEFFKRLVGKSNESSKKFAGLYLIIFTTILSSGVIWTLEDKYKVQLLISFLIAGCTALGIDAYNKTIWRKNENK